MIRKFDIQSVHGCAFSKQGRSVSQYSIKSSQTLSRSKNKIRLTVEEMENIQKSQKKQIVPHLSEKKQIPKQQNSTDNLFGMYNPQFKAIYKKVQAFRYHESKSPIVTEHTNNKHTNSSQNLQVGTDNSIAYQSKSLYVMDFKKQSGRKDIILHDVNENRFNYFPWPDISTKVNRVQNVSFAGQPRNDKYLGANISGMFYAKNFNLIEKRQDKGILNFQKQLGRLIQTPKYSYEEFLEKINSKTTKMSNVQKYSGKIATSVTTAKSYHLDRQEQRSTSITQPDKKTQQNSDESLSIMPQINIKNQVKL